MTVLDFADAATWGPALDEAAHAIERGALVVMPTDTVYGVAAGAFDPRAVQRLLDAKGRGRDAPPPVLIGRIEALGALAATVTPDVATLTDALWPGALTVIVDAHPSLAWDLGDTGGTVALRMPDHPGALALLRRTGPLAVSSANLTGHPPALNAHQALEQLGARVDVYLDAGEAPGQVPSTIVDATGGQPRVVRGGAIGLDRLRELVPAIGAAEAGA